MAFFIVLGNQDSLDHAPITNHHLCYDEGMVTLNAHFDGKVIVPDEPLDLPPNQKLRISV